MLNFLQISVVFSVCALARANYNGPYLFWGMPRLGELDNSAINGLDEELLKDVYTEASAIMIFVKNSSHRMNSQHYPSLENLLADRNSAYMSQSVLIYDPMDMNAKTEVIALSGTPEQEDIELCALFRDAEINYGENKVLGILANSLAPSTLLRQRREAEEEGTTTMETPVTSPAPESTAVVEDHLYYLAGKAIFHTSSPPQLKYADGESYNLTRHREMTVDTSGQNTIKLSVKFVVNKPDSDKNETTTIKCDFRVITSETAWTLVDVEIAWNKLKNSRSLTLPVVGDRPAATLNPLYSYKCSQSLVFSNENATLIMQNYQLQPRINTTTKRFGPAIDCVGFVTTPLLSGLFVSFICLIVLGISLTAILDIKTPNRFENSRSKQLTFTVQE